MHNQWEQDMEYYMGKLATFAAWFMGVGFLLLFGRILFDLLKGGL